MSCTRASEGETRRGQRAAAGGWGRGGPWGLWAHAQVRLVHAVLWGYRPVYFDPPTDPESGTGLGSPREQNPGLVCRTENRRIRLYPPAPHAFKVSGASQTFSDLCLKGVILAPFRRSTKAAVTSQSVAGLGARPWGPHHPPAIYGFGVWGEGRAAREGLRTHLCFRSICTLMTRGWPFAGRWWMSASPCMTTTRSSSRKWPPCWGPTTDRRRSLCRPVGAGGAGPTTAHWECLPLMASS